MIQLSYSPIAGSAVPVTLSFRDDTGAYYVPMSINYTFLALNTDKVTWQVVDNLYQVTVQPKSAVDITIPSISTRLLTETLLQRKILVTWTAYLGGQSTTFVEEVNFELQAMPTISNAPTPTPVTPTAVVVNSITYTPASVDGNCTPNSIIAITFNVPINEATLTGAVTLDGTAIEGALSNTGLIYSYQCSNLTTGSHALVLADTITSLLGGTFAGYTRDFTCEDILVLTGSVELSDRTLESLSGTATTLDTALDELVTAVKALQEA